MIGRSRSSRLNPTARSMARAGALAGPRNIAWLGRVDPSPSIGGKHTDCLAADCYRAVLTGRPARPHTPAPMTYGFVLVLITGLLLIGSGASSLQARHAHT